MKILVIIDVQNDFINGSLGSKEAQAIVPNVVNKIDAHQWDFIYTTQDTHNEQYLNTQEGKKLPVIHCAEGTDGWKINNEVLQALADKSFTRTYKDTFGSVKLVHLITNNLVCHPNMTDKDLDITLIGVCTDICVVSNAMLLKAYFPEARITTDASCCAGTSKEAHEAALLTMKSCQIEVINSAPQNGVNECAERNEEITNANESAVSEDTE